MGGPAFLALRAAFQGKAAGIPPYADAAGGGDGEAGGKDHIRQGADLAHQGQQHAEMREAASAGEQRILGGEEAVGRRRGTEGWQRQAFPLEHG